MGLLLHDYQTTVKSRATLAGIGVHSGKTVTVHFLPADADTGIVFHLSNGGEAREFRALVAEVGATDLCTMLGDPAGEHIGTVEHLHLAKDLGVATIRVATHCTEADVSEQHIGQARKLGLDTVGFLMMAHMASPEKLVQQALLMQGYGANCIYVTDRRGTCCPTT